MNNSGRNKKQERSVTSPQKNQPNEEDKKRFLQIVMKHMRRKNILFQTGHFRQN